MTPPSGPSSSDQRTAETAREALLAAGTELFAERGFDGAKVEAIARRAGVNKAMINYHFGGKEGLYTTILLDTLEAARRRLEELGESSEPADVRLRQFVEAFAAITTRRPAFPAMVLREVIAGGGHVEEDLVGRILEIFRVLQGILEEGIEEGAFRRADPLLTHLTVVGGLLFFFATQTFRERILAAGHPPLSPPEPEAFVHHLQELLARGLAPRDST